MKQKYTLRVAFTVSDPKIRENWSIRYRSTKQLNAWSWAVKQASRVLDAIARSYLMDRLRVELRVLVQEYNGGRTSWGDEKIGLTYVRLYRGKRRIR